MYWAGIVNRVWLSSSISMGLMYSYQPLLSSPGMPIIRSMIFTLRGIGIACLLEHCLVGATAALRTHYRHGSEARRL